MLIDISGRQRMLTQKISKETCIIGGRHQTDGTIADLQGTVQIFEASLEALRFGMPSVGILPPPNAEISAGLNTVVTDWNTVKPMISAMLASEDLETAAHAQKYQQLNVTMSDMNAVVGLYADVARPRS